MFREYFARIRAWSPEPKTASVIIVFSTLVIIVAVSIIYLIVANHNQTEMQAPVVDNSADPQESIVFAKLVPIEPTIMRLYVQEFPEFGTEFNYECSGGDTSPIAAGVLAAPYSEITNVQPGQTVVCIVKSDRHENIETLPATSFEREFRTANNFQWTHNLGGSDELIYRVRWEIEGEPLNSGQQVFQYVLTDDNGEPLGFGRKNIVEGELSHLLPNGAEEAKQVVFSVKGPTLSDSDWLHFVSSGDANGQWRTVAVEDAEEVAALNVIADKWETGADPSAIIENVTVDSNEVVLKLGSPGWVIFSEFPNTVSLGETLGVLYEGETLIVPSEEILNVNYVSGAEGDPNYLWKSQLLWRAANIKVNLEGSQNVTFDWDMIRTGVPYASWVEHNLGSFIVKVTDALTGVEYLYAGDSSPSAVFSDLDYERPYRISISYADMEAGAPMVVESTFNLFLPKPSAKITGTRYQGSYAEKKLEININQFDASSPFWLQVEDESGALIINERYEGIDSSRIIKDLGSFLNAEEVNVRVLAEHISGDSYDEPFVKLSNGKSAVRQSPAVFRLSATQTAGRALMLTWQTEIGSVASEDLSVRIEQMEDTGWVEKTTLLGANQHEIAVEDKSMVLYFRVRTTTDNSVSEYSYLSCTLNNVLICD